MSRVVTLISILFFTVFSLPLVAYAQSDVPTFDALRSAQLSIHKTKSDTDTLGEPLAGVTFTVQQVLGIDLGDTSAWGVIAELDARDVQQHPEKLGVPVQASTELIDSNTAAAVFTDLPLGVYVVSEQPARIGDVSYSVTAPFLVTLPMNVGYGWRYDVTVNAKNQPITINKTSSPDVVHAGDSFDYVLRSSIPAPDRYGKLYRYIVKDTLASNVSYHSATVSVFGDVQVVLQEIQDYRLDFDKESNTVVVKLTEHGLGVLVDARVNNPAAQVQVDLHVRVEGYAGSIVDNTAYLFPDGYNPDVVTGIASNTHRVVISEQKKPHNNELDKRDAHKPPVISHTPGGDSQSRSDAQQTDVLGRIPVLGKLALTGAGIYWICAIGAAALFLGALLIYIRDRKQRNAQQ